MDSHPSEERTRFLLKPPFGHLEVFGVDLRADAVATPTRRRNCRGSGADERIKHGVPDEAEHSHETFGERNWIWRRVVLGGCAGDTGPDLLEPLLVILAGDNAQDSCGDTRCAVTAWLAFHQDELDIVLDYGIGLVGFAEKPSP